MNDELKHTPAPWRWWNGNTLMGDHGRRPIVLYARNMVTINADGFMEPNNSNSADCRLISVAPELLKALKRADTELRLRIGLCTNRTQDEKEMLREIFDVIQKAEGRE